MKTQKVRFAAALLMSILGVLIQAGIVEGVVTAAGTAVIFPPVLTS